MQYRQQAARGAGADRKFSMQAMAASELPLERIGRGKVRDIYAVDAERLLLVATDRVSAFDVVMGEPVPISL